MELQIAEGRIYYENEQNEVLAEVTYVPIAEGVVDINHTYVDPSLRGHGIAGELMKALAAELRARGLKASATCSYAEIWLARNRAANEDIMR